ncbi:TonB-dependent receptor [Porticoccaceae bacterium LTM1]|nr:TonB-dependent receptor [Porticoccaceae bacterium LTM1]
MKVNSKFYKHPLAATIFALTSSATLTTIPAHASEEIIEEVLSIGTRVAGRTATESAVPVDVINESELTKNGFTELGQSLQVSAPSFNFSRTQVSDGSDLFRPATLRGLQPDQTLVLVNGKRRHTQAIFALSGTVGEGAAGTDMNAIPLSALRGVEVLRDGAAAQYGSDAIAGVINLNLKETVDETTSYLQWGQTKEGDGDTLSLGINSGFELGDDGGFINLTFEYRDGDRTNRAQRDIGGSSTIAPGELSDDVRWHMGDADTEFTTVFYNAMLPLAGGELYSFGGLSNRTALGSGFYRDFNRVERNVPQVYPDGFLPNIDNEADDSSIAVGFRTDLSNDWRMDTSLTYGQNEYAFTSRNTINSSIAAEYLFNNPGASDAEIAANAGPTSGFSGGFEFDQLTFNLDFSGHIDTGSDELLYVSYGAELREESYKIISGDLASYSCGSSDSGVFPSVIDGTTPADCGFQAYPGLRPEAATSADRSSYALYLDLEKNFTDKWLAGAALRFEDYEEAGNELSGKLSSRYDFSETFALRGALSTGFRAPSLQQSAYTAFTTNIGSDGSLAQSFTASSGSELPSALGVTNLKLETSESASFGMVWSPLDSITVTLDAYKVEIQDRITLGGFLSADDLAFNPAALAALEATGVAQANFFSNAVDTTTEGVDLIITHNTEFAEGNLNITFAGNINETTVDKINAPVGIDPNVAFSPLSESFLTNGQPQERSTLTFDWSRDKLSALVRFNYFGETEVDYFGQNHIPIPETQPTSVVESAVLVDLNLSYDVTEKVTLSFGANNLFDKTPDELAANEVLDIITNNAAQYPLRALPYGFNGASYYLKMSARF